MKYGYENADLGELIQKYETTNDKIIITFLDSSNYEMPLTEENEKALLNKMLEQAQKRNERSSITDVKQRMANALFWTMLHAGLTTINVATAFVTDSDSIRTGASIIGSFTALNIVVNGINYIVRKDEIAELKKYDMYLAIRARLENVTDPNLFNGVKEKEEPLNINTLDNYSLSDMKKIRNNLRKCEEYSSYFDQNSSSPTLTKRISKHC